jgi:hypothetical protein
MEDLAQAKMLPITTKEKFCISLSSSILVFAFDYMA